jgi:hypothetical protein
MSNALLQVAIGVAAYILLCSVPATAFLKFFARPLTWGQAFIISIFCLVITTAKEAANRDGPSFTAHSPLNRL